MASPPESESGNVPLTLLIARLARQAVELVSAELDLARVEAEDRARLVGRALIPAALLVATLTIALQAFAAAAVIVLGRALGQRYGLSAVIVGSALLVVSVLFYRVTRVRFERALRGSGALHAIEQGPSSSDVRGELGPGEGQLGDG